MYTAEKIIGDMKDRPLFENWYYIQDAGGGNIKKLDNSFNLWANVEDGGSSRFVGESKVQWTVDIRVTIRYNSNVNISTTLIYSGSRYIVNSITITDDRFQVLSCTKLQGNIAAGTATGVVPNAYVYNYTATGGETGFTVTSLINKTIIGAYKDGIAYKVIFSGTPQPKEVLYTAITGQFTFGDPFFDDEVAIIQYI